MEVARGLIFILRVKTFVRPAAQFKLNRSTRNVSNRLASCRPAQTWRGAVKPHGGSGSKPIFMYILELIGRMIFNLLKQAWRLPKTVPIALQQRRRQLAQQQFEAERLDRIRNPSKYLGS